MTDRTRASDDSLLQPRVDAELSATPVSPAAATPDLTRTRSGLDSTRAIPLSLIILATLAVAFTLYFARAFLIPIAFALMLNFLFSPVVRWLRRLKIPHPLGAAIVLLALIAGVTVGAYELAGPVQRWAAEAPRIVEETQGKLRSVIQPIQRAGRTAETVASAASGSDEAGGPAPAQEVVVKGPSLLSRAFGTTTRAGAALLQVLFLLYFLLAAGDLFLQKLIKVLPNLGEKRKAVEIARETESSISRYLLTMSMISFGEAVVVTGVMHMWGMPNPLLWGALAFMLEFIPYLGALVMCVVLAVAALASLGTTEAALLVPASFLVINVIQGNIVSPLLLGHNLSLNPVALFIGLAFWFTIWGIPGAFLAVPMMATFKIFCDHIESLASIGEFLGGRDDNERRLTVRDSDAVQPPAAPS